MSPELAAIGQELVNQLKPMLDEAFVRVATAPGNPAERVNDALSTIATVGAFVAQQLTARLMFTKQAPLDVAATIALDEIARRLISQIVEVTSAGRA
jgi:hypothetical protein